MKMSATALEFTAPKTEWGFFDRIYLWVRHVKSGDKKCTPTAQKVLGHVSTRAPKKDENPQKGYTLPWRKIQKSFGASNTSISRGLKELKGGEILKAVRRNMHGIEYACMIEAPGKKLYDVIPHYLYTARIKDGKTMRPMSANEVSCAGHLLTLAQNKALLKQCIAGKDENGEKLTYNKIAKAINAADFTCKVNVAEMAKALNLSKATVYKAIKALDEAGIIWVTYGKNRYKRECRVRIAEKKLYSYLLYLRPKKEKVAQETVDANARAERERYYLKLRECAENKAEKARKAELSEEGQAILAEMGLKSSDLLPRYQCSKCADTGYKPSGAVCDCYVRHRLE